MAVARIRREHWTALRRVDNRISELGFEPAILARRLYADPASNAKDTLALQSQLQERSAFELSPAARKKAAAKRSIESDLLSMPAGPFVRPAGLPLASNPTQAAATASPVKLSCCHR